MPARATEIEIIRFRKDLKRLRTKLMNLEIADRMGIKASAVSSYASGKRNPSKETIEKFYQIFGDQLKQMEYQDDSEQIDQTQRVDDPPTSDTYTRPNGYQTTTDRLIDHILLDKERAVKEKDEMWIELKGANKNITSLVQDTHTLVQNYTILAEEIRARRGGQDSNGLSGDNPTK
jgi:transcriptional regulator with XRE-family HTH domain